QVNSNWYFGAYLQNFRDISRGIRSRVNDLSYGLLIKREIPSDVMRAPSPPSISPGTHAHLVYRPPPHRPITL
nr:hypothetical protein [Nostoc sp. CHAB 5844]